MARDQYQTVTDVAVRLKVSEVTVRSWVRQGELRAINIGKGWRIADHDLNAFLCRHATRPRQLVTQDNSASDAGSAAGRVAQT